MQSSNSFFLGVIIVLIATVMTVEMFLIKYDDNDSESSVSSTSSFSFTFAREGYDVIRNFQDRDNWRSYDFLDNYMGIIEPSAPMVLHVDTDSENVYKYKFVVCPKLATTDSECVWGELNNVNYEAITIACTPHDIYNVTIYQQDIDQNMVVFFEYAMCLYVRRELRNLTLSDRDQIFDAMYLLHVTSEEEGQRLYGEHFHNSTFFLRAHYFAASFRDSDHIHEGYGFLTQHLKLTYYYEKSLQAVNPSISLFYWDYTIDGDLAYPIYDSPMFTPETFGTLRGPINETMCWQHGVDNMEDARIQDGRWKDFRVEQMSPYADKYDFLQQGM